MPTFGSGAAMAAEGGGLRLVDWLVAAAESGAAGARQGEGRAGKGPKRPMSHAQSLRASVSVCCACWLCGWRASAAMRLDGFLLFDEISVAEAQTDAKASRGRKRKQTAISPLIVLSCTRIGRAVSWPFDCP
jgi:hypothetical protein